MYELKVTINNIEPPIWRSFQVPGEITLARLHKILQIVMGWEDYHLYEFRAGKQRFVGALTTADGRAGRKNIQDTRKIKLSAVLHRKGQKLNYIYDFDGFWPHTIEVVKIVAEDNEINGLLCTGGQRACPPENCGSYRGYLDIIAQLKLGADQRNHALMERLELGYDPEFFDINEVNRWLKRLKL